MYKKIKTYVHNIYTRHINIVSKNIQLLNFPVLNTGKDTAISYTTIIFVTLVMSRYKCTLLRIAMKPNHKTGSVPEFGRQGDNSLH